VAADTESASPPDADERTVLERAGAAAAAMGTLGPKHPRARAALQAGLAVLIFGFLIGFVLSQWSKLPDYDWRFEAGWLAAAAAAVGCFYILQGEIWRLILRSLGEDLAGRPARAVYGKSLVARYVPTNLLMVVGRVVLAERFGVPKRVTLASLAYEVGLAVCAAVMLGAYFVITLPALEDQPARWAVLAVIPLALAVLHPRAFRPLVDWALGKLGRERLPQALPFSRVLAFALLYVVSFSAVGLGVYAFASALHPVGADDLLYVAASYPMAFCVAVLTFILPSGLGSRDAALATALGAVLPDAVAVAVAVAFRIFQTAIELVYVGTVAAAGRRA
jgi:uncharacterized membrane protein YbhN (UPF0104 family)